MKSRAIIPLVLGLAIGGFALKMFVDVLKKARAGSLDTVDVVRARVDIGPATEIIPTMVELAKVPASLAPKLIFSDPQELVGRVTTQTIPQGTPVVPSLLAPKGTPPGMAAKIPDGYRAVAVKVDEFVGVAGWIKPGCRVDVVAVMTGRRGNDNETVSKVLLQNVEVLAVGQDIGTNNETAASVAKSVTLLVKPDAVPKLHLAATKGTLRLAMRNQIDANDPKNGPQTTDNELFGGEKAGKDTAKASLGMLAQLFAKQKPTAKATDKESAAPKSTAPAPAPQQTREWAVEVMSGSNHYNVVFENDEPGARCLSGAGGKAKRAGAPSAASRGTGSSKLTGKTFEGGSGDPAADIDLQPAKPTEPQ